MYLVGARGCVSQRSKIVPFAIPVGSPCVSKFVDLRKIFHGDVYETPSLFPGVVRRSVLPSLLRAAGSFSSQLQGSRFIMTEVVLSDMGFNYPIVVSKRES